MVDMPKYPMELSSIARLPKAAPCIPRLRTPQSFNSLDLQLWSCSAGPSSNATHSTNLFWELPTQSSCYAFYLFLELNLGWLKALHSQANRGPKFVKQIFEARNMGHRFQWLKNTKDCLWKAWGLGFQDMTPPGFQVLIFFGASGARNMVVLNV